MPQWFPDQDSWPAASPARLAVLEELTEHFRLLEDQATGTRVGIGIATGADKVFLTKDDTAVESSRLLPMAMVRDTTTGSLNWSGTYLVNPWTASGDLVDLDEYPRLAAYFEEHGAALRKRYVAAKQPKRWYKTSSPASTATASTSTDSPSAPTSDRTDLNRQHVKERAYTKTETLPQAARRVRGKQTNRCPWPRPQRSPSPCSWIRRQRSVVAGLRDPACHLLHDVQHSLAKISRGDQHPEEQHDDDRQLLVEPAPGLRASA